MSTPIQEIPHTNDSAAAAAEDPSLVQSILSEMGAAMDSAPSASAPAAVTEAFDARPGGAHEDDVLEFVGDDGFFDLVDGAPTMSTRERLLMQLRLPLVASMAVLLVSVPTVRRLLREVLVARLPVSDAVKALVGDFVLPALIVAAATWVMQQL